MSGLFYLLLISSYFDANLKPIADLYQDRPQFSCTGMQSGLIVMILCGLLVDQLDGMLNL